MNKEQVYDADIQPLMAKILEVCMREKIAMVAQFSIPTEEDPELVCTSCLTKPEFEPTAAIIEAVKVLTSTHGSGLVAMTITETPRSEP